LVNSKSEGAATAAGFFKFAGAFLEVARRTKKLEVKKLSYTAFRERLNVVNVISLVTVNEHATMGAKSILRRPNPITLFFAF
jgi:hypothetical protein